MKTKLNFKILATALLFFCCLLITNQAKSAHLMPLIQNITHSWIGPNCDGTYDLEVYSVDWEPCTKTGGPGCTNVCCATDGGHIFVDLDVEARPIPGFYNGPCTQSSSTPGLGGVNERQGTTTPINADESTMGGCPGIPLITTVFPAPIVYTGLDPSRYTYTLSAGFNRVSLASACATYNFPGTTDPGAPAAPAPVATGPDFYNNSTSTGPVACAAASFEAGDDFRMDYAYTTATPDGVNGWAGGCAYSGFEINWSAIASPATAGGFSNMSGSSPHTQAFNIVETICETTTFTVEIIDACDGVTVLDQHTCVANVVSNDAQYDDVSGNHCPETTIALNPMQTMANHATGPNSDYAWSGTAAAWVDASDNLVIPASATAGNYDLTYTVGSGVCQRNYTQSFRVLDCCGAEAGIINSNN